jgi:hypothetical protein
LYGDYKKIHDYQNVSNHNEEYHDMSIKDKVLQGLLRNFSRVCFELIDIFMNSKHCFNPPHSRDFMNPNDDVYYVVFFHDFSPCENMGSNEKLNCEEALEKDASPFATCDLVLHYAKTLEEGNSWAIPSNLHIVGHNTPRIFSSPPTKLKTIVIART